MQCTHHLLMIRPLRFGFNAATAVNNSFQKDTQEPVQEKAVKEFDDLVLLLRKNRLSVTVINDTPEPYTPDSIFPNNWVSFHAGGTVNLYPMFALNRRLERSEPVMEAIASAFHVKQVNDLTCFETDGLFLEGTGSMVLDHVNRIAYACLSPRTNAKVLAEFCRVNDYEPEIFTACNAHGTAIYHTNVMLCVADRYVVICLDAIGDEPEKQQLVKRFTDTNKLIIGITQDQLEHFCGNMLQVINADGDYLLIMSSQAYEALSPGQVMQLEQFNRIVHSPLNNIEAAGGGSARCMIAEIFLRPK